MRQINRVFLHCTATRAGQHFTVAEIRRWHTDPPPRGNGWKDIGYHWVVYLDGSVHPGRAESVVGAHVAGHNTDSIGIAYVGGMSADGKRAQDTRTPPQIVAMDALIDGIRARYGQHVTVHGHNEVDFRKACPSFDVQIDRRARRR